MRLSQEERKQCEQVVDKLEGTTQKVRRAKILVEADVAGQAWTDSRIAEAFRCRIQTVENIRKKCVLEGFQAALEHMKPFTPPATRLDGDQEARLIAARLGPPPPGYANWTLRLFVRQALVNWICFETIES